MEPAAALREASDEHIIPYALGGSDQFTLRADRGTNSKLACYRIDDIVVTVVRLFGQPLLSLVCVIPSDGFKIAPLEGSVVVNDSQRRTIVERTLLQAGRF